MRYAVVQVILFGVFYCLPATALDLQKYEELCSSIGFKQKTPAFGECVLELRAREAKSSKGRADELGDGSVDHATCRKYGFISGSAEYSQCRMQIDLARAQALDQKRQYEEQVAAQQRARERAKGEAALLMGLGMLAGQQRPSTSGFNAIEPLPPINRIYNLPGGKFMTCNTLGMVTNCQ